ncbi:ABC-three component system protein [Rhizobium phaseoli]|uniref:ABC-three component system protein n=1 Tax=Rhizobium phaseoli TaxID=396 RepID=UPI000BEA1C05|nr:ABC-three component system protein [Rhizobium phaseoli]PDS29258.1 hypothetical protein CO650_21735 [Rhizobium phaseoli]
MESTNAHSADAAALGFLYQAQFALIRLWNETSDDAVVLLETLDDVVLVANGQTILEQLKHSLSEKPASLTISSVNLWKTLKAWIDVLPELDLSQTWLHLVTVADIANGSPLLQLTVENGSRESLLQALVQEAERVAQERAEASANGDKKLPHAQRAAACDAFLKLPPEQQASILARARIKSGAMSITQIEPALADAMTSVLENKRAQVAMLLVEWWNRQIILALSKVRKRAIRRFELVSRYMAIIGDIEHDTLTDYFATELPPESYQSHPMVAQQVNLVGASQAVLDRAVLNEWRARAARSRWSIENPARHEMIAKYDDRLAEEWSYRHVEMCEECGGSAEEDKRSKGRKLLGWSHFDAPNYVGAIAPNITASYVRGSYQVLSINGRVGWHPDYRKLLEFDK